MTIRKTSMLPVDRCVDMNKERRYGNLFEDDIALHIRYFSLFSVSEYETDPGDPTTKVRDITFEEGEIEYEYWYSLYGKPFNESQSNGFRDFKDLKTITFRHSLPYDEELKFCVHQSSLSNLPFFEEHIEAGMSYASYCDPFVPERPEEDEEA